MVLYTRPPIVQSYRKPAKVTYKKRPTSVGRFFWPYKKQENDAFLKVMRDRVIATEITEATESVQ